MAGSVELAVLRLLFPPGNVPFLFFAPLSSREEVLLVVSSFEPNIFLSDCAANFPFLKEYLPMLHSGANR